MATLKQALENPSSGIHAKIAHARAVMAENTKRVDALVTQGWTREQAWAEAMRCKS